MQANYKVYRHTSPSGKVYIGITKLDTARRWKNGKGYKENPYFWRAINRHGWEAFTHKVLFTGLTQEEACAREIALIALYDSTNSAKGYNLTKGGDHPKIEDATRQRMKEAHKRHRVRCVETGVVYESLKAAQRETGLDDSHISRVCRRSPTYKTAGGFHWEFVEDENIKE